MNAEGLYRILDCVEVRGEIGNAYDGCGTIEAERNVLRDFYDGIIEKYRDSMPLWAEAFTQVFLWQFQTLRECAKTYYANYHGNSEYETILKVADYLQQNGYYELAKQYASAAVDCQRYEYPDDWIKNNEETVWNFYVDILRKHSDELTLREVIVKINEEVTKINIIRAFRGMNPITKQYNVNLMLSDKKRCVRLFLQNNEDTDILVQKIREGEITDLTKYPAEML